MKSQNGWNNVRTQAVINMIVQRMIAFHLPRLEAIGPPYKAPIVAPMLVTV